MSTTLPLFDEPETPESESTTELRIADEPIVVRRSELENYANCPLAARMAGSVSKLAEAGEQCHQIIAGAIRKFVTTKGHMKAPDLADFMIRGSWEARGDVNQETVDAMRPGAWSIARYISELHWSNILAFDGGEFGEDGKKLTASYTYEDEEGCAFTEEITCSGQFDADIDVLHPITDELQAMRLTAEFDLLHSVRYPNRLQLVDWKTGHAKWTDAMVESSFQFQFYAYLVLASFPTMDAVDVIIFNVRHNTRTAGVRFLRSDMDRIRGRIEEACRTYLMNYLIPLEQVETRPSREGCQFCDQAARCTVCDWDIHDTAADPPRALRHLIVLEQAVKCRKTGLNAECKKSGDDIQSGNDKYGMKKPRSRIVPGFYSASASIEDGGEE